MWDATHTPTLLQQGRPCLALLSIQCRLRGLPEGQCTSTCVMCPYATKHTHMHDKQCKRYNQAIKAMHAQLGEGTCLPPNQHQQEGRQQRNINGCRCCRTQLHTQSLSNKVDDERTRAHHTTVHERQCNTVHSTNKLRRHSWHTLMWAVQLHSPVAETALNHTRSICCMHAAGRLQLREIYQATQRETHTRARHCLLLSYRGSELYRI